MEESSFSVLQRLFFSPEKERNPVSSGFKGRRRERRKRKKMRCLAWRMGFLGGG